MVQANGYRDNRGIIRVLTPDDLNKIIKSVDSAYRLESNLAGLPFGFEQAADYLNGITDDTGRQDPHSGLSELPSRSLRPIDVTPEPDAVERD